MLVPYFLGDISSKIFVKIGGLGEKVKKVGHMGK